MRKTFTIAFFCLSFLVLKVSAQQDPQFSQNMFTKLCVNPGFAGSNDAICGTLLYRNQWTGFGGEPKTMLLTADMPVEMLHGGVGLTVYAADGLGVEKNLNARLAYAYRADLGSGRIGIGVDFGMHQKSLNGSKFVYNDANDNNIPTGNVSGSTFDLGFGAYYNTDKLYVGLSSAHLTEGEINYDNITSSLARHYYLMAGYSLDLTSSLTLKPMVQLKSDAVSTQADINANLFINSRYWVGASYRLQDAIVLMAGLEIMPNLKLGYAYDLTTSEIKTYSSGTHEIMLGYCYKPVKVVKRQFHRNVRFL
ncbi:MAG TPA: type IX secretion system membrane protein PorP/SprF [Bacteroidia bacterium]|jgi:type IX secretion system PorP/SprF family membrane protein|nr:type IX secretion system membrane protein PorP/SprF [Bacteroidota bacterium]MBK7570718.1 type IX secretion system membrane protein PorP/SprF [Bacteroidota bacterium]MBP9790616.1 type IX secretion system membrane protein PorP/SprF [Bacteroidia bacterium]MBP9923958.1 type IX secretion system membrane protein PorP/SprF [Bacteroidia bacterium]HQW22920.1 type IX secretion system membrane protein PorP/SprF [Bacteroidia bacterium]